MNYAGAIEALRGYGRFGRKPGLQRIRRLISSLDLYPGFPVVLVAGTVGKGSTVVLLESVLRAAGYRIGSFLSPHLESYRERIRLDGNPLDEVEFAQGLELALAAESGPDEPPTQFELLTLAALAAFRRHQPDLVILEVGLGGRFDATNALEPSLSVITRIDLDHTAQLGDSVAAIAAEKAGITRRAVPLVVGENPAAALEVFARIAAEKGLPWRRSRELIGTRGDWRGQNLRYHEKPLHLGLPGPYQLENAATALAALEALAEQGWRTRWEHLEQGLEEVRFPGRLECLSQTPKIVLDGAHNPVGMGALCRGLPAFAYNRLFAVVGIMADKDYGSMLEILARAGAFPTFVRADSVRGADPLVLAGRWPVQAGPAETAASVQAALERVLGEAGPADLVLVTGSLYLVGQARSLLKGGEDCWCRHLNNRAGI